MVKYLVNHGASLKEKDSWGKAALLYAAASGWVEMVEWLVNHGASLKEKDNARKTALLCAAERGRVEMVEWPFFLV